MQYRPYGQTGIDLSVIGFGGIIVTRTTTTEAARAVAEAIDAGVNYFDVAPSYGNAEEMLGPALAPYRDKVFLACKTNLRDKAGAARQLRESLAKLKCDHFDLYQLHGLAKMEDVEQAFGPGGAMEVLREARELGLVRYLGFSVHHEAAAVRAMELYDFDSVLFPCNYWAWHVGHFGETILKTAEARGVARLALKALARGLLDEGEPRPWAKAWYRPLDEAPLALAAVRWTLAQNITAAVSPGHVELLRLALQAAADLRPPDPDELALLAGALGERRPVFAT